jgi:hypothetical protein
MALPGWNMFAMLKDLVMKRVMIVADKGAPGNGVTGDNLCDRGSLYIDTTNGVLYINTGSITNPTWTKVGTQT